MSQAHLTITESFAVPPERLWAVFCDHEGMTDWMGARVTVVAGPGDGGVGTVRRIHARGLVLDEEVTYADPPRRMVYRIVRGLPVIRFHRGEILVSPWGKTGSELRWDIVMESPLPGVPRALAAILEPSIRAGLRTLRARLASRAERATA